MGYFRTEGREGYTRLKPGKYFWKVEEAENAYKDGIDQIKLILRVGDKQATMKVYETLTFSEKAYFRVEHFMKSAGIYPGDGVDVDLDAHDCVGLSGWCITADREATNGKTYASIDTWLAASKQNSEHLRRLPAIPDNANSDSHSDFSSDDIPF